MRRGFQVNYEKLQHSKIYHWTRSVFATSEDMRHNDWRKKFTLKYAAEIKKISTKKFSIRNYQKRRGKLIWIINMDMDLNSVLTYVIIKLINYNKELKNSKNYNELHVEC